MSKNWCKNMGRYATFRTGKSFNEGITRRWIKMTSAGTLHSGFSPQTAKVLSDDSDPPGSEEKHENTFWGIPPLEKGHLF